MNPLPPSLAIYALTPRGAEKARELAAGLSQAQIFLPDKLTGSGETGFAKLTQALSENFLEYSGHLVFAAAGIVVRTISGLLQGKDVDPAVVVLDQNGAYAVSLVSGHLGGANDLAREAALILGGQAVITTATDTQGLPSLETIAVARGCRVENISALSRLSAALLEAKTIPVYDPGGWLRPALQEWEEHFGFLTDPPGNAYADQPLAWVHWEARELDPAWLVIRPPALAAGMGCNRGASTDEIELFLEAVLQDNRLSRECVSCLASAQAKADEPGINELAQRWMLSKVFYAHDLLDQVEVPNPSAQVEKHLGTRSVCEAAAMLASGSRQLIVTKQKTPNVTLALALIPAPDDSMS